MRELIDAIAKLFEAEQLDEKAAGAAFRLAPFLDPANYQITDNLGAVRRWKAKILAANNGGTIGAWDDVGYVMISKLDNTIIPIARNDEHRQGYDLLWDMQDKGIKVTPQNYIPVFWSGNYIYSKDEIANWLNVAGKYLAYGGPDNILKGVNSGVDGILMSLSQFVENKGAVKIEKGVLAPLGKQYLDLHTKLSEVFVQALSTQKNGPAFAAATKMIEYYAGMHYKFAESPDELKALKKAVAEARRNADLNELQNLFFGFNSPKNKLHIEMKKALKEGKKNWDYADMIAFWGDLPLAIDMLARL